MFFLSLLRGYFNRLLPAIPTQKTEGLKDVEAAFAAEILKDVPDESKVQRWRDGITVLRGGNTGAVTQGPPVADPSRDQTAALVRKLLMDTPLIPPAAHELAERLAEGLNARLPVVDYLYDSLTSKNMEFSNLLEKASVSNAWAFASHVNVVLTTEFQPGTDEISLSGILDSMLYDIWELMQRYSNRLTSLKRKRNSTEDYMTLRGSRPDFMAFVGDVLLFKGEDKTHVADSKEAGLELESKLKEWKQVSKMPYLLCYTNAGGYVRFCYLGRDEPWVHYLTEEFSCYSELGKIGIIKTAVNLYRILCSLAVAAGREWTLPMGTVISKDDTTIYCWDTTVTKKVKVAPSAERLKELKSVYQSAASCPHLVHAVKPRREPKVTGRGEYVVQLSPFGYPLGRAHSSHMPRDQRTLKLAVRHILLALQALHHIGYGHGDLRWENIICVGDSAQANMRFVVIDLELVVKLGTKPNPLPAICTTAVLQEDGTYTAASDLYLLGRLMEDVDVALDDVGMDLITQLLEKRILLEDALKHRWLMH